MKEKTLSKINIIGLMLAISGFFSPIWYFPLVRELALIPCVTQIVLGFGVMFYVWYFVTLEDSY